MHILICDDVFLTRKLLGRILEEFGTCDFAENGLVAVEAVQSALDEGQPYHLICLDIRMPSLDGEATLARIRELEKAAGKPLFAKIVMITGVDDKSSIFGSFRNNCDGYLIKPVQKQALVKLLVEFGLHR